MSEQPPERPENFEDYSNERDLVPFSQAMEEAVDMIDESARENEPVAGARNHLRELLDPKARGNREVSDEELGAALLELGAALRGDKDEGTSRPQ